MLCSDHSYTRHVHIYLPTRWIADWHKTDKCYADNLSHRNVKGWYYLTVNVSLNRQRQIDRVKDGTFQNLYSPSKHGITTNNKQYKRNQNNYSTDKKHSKLTSNLATRLAQNTLGKEKSKYSWQYFTVWILSVVKSFMKNLLITKWNIRKCDLVKGHASVH